MFGNVLIYYSITACVGYISEFFHPGSESCKEVKSSMYAIILTGGKQYKVSEGSVVKVEKLDAEIGSIVKLDVLMLVDDNGNVIAGNACNAVAEAEVTYIGKGKKINIFKYKAKKNIRKRQGHRQPYTEVKIVKIGA